MLNDARDLCALLTDSLVCGYLPSQVTQLLDNQATGGGIRSALADLASRTGPDDTAILFFSGHGAQASAGGSEQQYILPYDCDPTDLSGTAISGAEMTAMLREIKADRLLVLFDSWHSGGAGDPKELLPQLKTGLSEDYYQALAQGKGRVVIASSRPDEVSWVPPRMNNSLFTYYLLEALRGQGKTLGDGYGRVFDLFRHVADYISTKVNQHLILKAAAMEEDFVVALARMQKWCTPAQRTSPANSYNTIPANSLTAVANSHPRHLIQKQSPIPHHSQQSSVNSCPCR